MTYAFQTHNLVKKYDNIVALNGLDMRVPTSSIYGFVGVNGAGKTTTFGIAASFIHATSGTFEINGKLAVLPQDARFYYGRSVGSQLNFFARLSGVSSSKIKGEVNKVLKQVGLQDKSNIPAQKLSHGMYKRLGIAQVLLGSPDVLLLDEPTAGLDPENAFEIRKLIKTLGKEKTLVVSSHNLHEVSDICTHVGVIHEGKIIFEGKMDEISKSVSKVKFILGSVKESQLSNLLKNLIWIKNFSLEENNELHVIFFGEKVSLEEANKQILKVFFNAGIGVREIYAGKSLEESFLEMIKK